MKRVRTTRRSLLRGLVAVVAALPAPAQAPTEADATTLVQELDRAFNARNLGALLAHYVPDRQTHFFAAMRARLHALFLRDGLSACSRVLRFFHRGHTGIALVATELTAPSQRASLHTFTALRRQAGRVVALFSIDVDPRAAIEHAHGSSFACPACNYRIRFDDRWLAVPRAQSEGGCTEALWLVSLERDVFLDIGVTHCSAATDARHALDRILQAKRTARLLAEDDSATPSAWLPRGIPRRDTADLGVAVSGARYQGSCRGGLAVDMHVLAAGRMVFLLAARGNPSALCAARAEVDAVLDSFELVDPKLTAAQMAERALRLHTGGGTFDGPCGNRYRNPTHRVAITGPTGWDHQLRAGAFLFHLTFRNPTSGSSLELYALPPRDRPFCPNSIERLVTTQCPPGSGAKSTDWQTTGCGLTWRQVELADDSVLRVAFR
ncbi:MAG: hypothetical protein KDC87_20750, partial [Planctomycetes bacterium]|nr:hypothetical protein [Planctomycetota bacterium]